MDLKESTLLGDQAAAHWYYRSKAAAVVKYLSDRKVNRILDVGAGSGFFTKHLLQHSSATSGLCVDTGYARDHDEQCSGKPVAFRRSCDGVDADVVLFMDVLEHVDDDAGLLASYAAKVPAGAAFLITVPAFQWLWSGHDVFLEHKRRYDLAQLERTIRAAGLALERSSYYFGLVLPIAAAVRLGANMTWRPEPAPRSHLKMHGSLVNGVLSTLCLAELPLVRFNRVGGLSVFALAFKP